ncbi:MAG: adenylate kinase, partial [Anaerolineales bacterium]
YLHFQRMLYHEPGTRLGEDIEELHDMRVATRRMRAAFQVFGDYLDMEQMAPFLKGLRRTGRALGGVRDLDVFWEKTQHYLDTLPPEQPVDLGPLRAVWEAQRQIAREQMVAYLDSKRYSRFKTEFEDFLQKPDAGALPVISQQGEPAPHRLRHVVPVAVYQRLGAVLAYDEWVTAPNVPLERLHQLRITAKALRYTLEYFEEVLGSEAKNLIDEVKGLQDHLGDLQDAVVASNLLRDFLTWGTWGHAQAKKAAWPQEPIVAPGVATYLAARQAELQNLVETFPQTWARFQRPEFGQLVALAVAPLLTAANSFREVDLVTTEPKCIVLLGPPASGKGTQAAQLREALHLPHVASGDLFREHFKNETELGLRAKVYIDRGELVPDDLTIAMVWERLSQPDCADGALLDGFPRTIAQAEALDQALASRGYTIHKVPNIVVPDEVLVERVSGRRLCRTCGEPYHIRFNPPRQPGICDKDGGELYQRDDDRPETVRKRLKVYWEQTSPLIDYYRKQGVLVDINGNQPIDAVQAELRAAVSNV